jgi:hypothetical protein
MRESRNRDYSAISVNSSCENNNWDINKIIVTKGGKDICNINCKTRTISYLNLFGQNLIKSIQQLRREISEQDEVLTKASH